MSGTGEHFDYKTEVDKMMLAARFLTEVDLQGITDTISRAHSLGPFVDPTMYRDALYKGDMDRFGDLAEALKKAKGIIGEMLTKVLA